MTKLGALGVGLLLVALGFGCGSADPANAGGQLDQAGELDDGGVRTDAGLSGAGGGDAGIVFDGAVGVPESCTNDIDDDHDGLLDCSDDDCWSAPGCAAKHVAMRFGGLSPCGNPISLDATAASTACGSLAAGSGNKLMYAINCGTIALTATAQPFCSSSGAIEAVWIDERVATPADKTESLSSTHFKETYYDWRGAAWERYAVGIGTTTGGAGPALFVAVPKVNVTGRALRAITVRAAADGASLARLLTIDVVTEDIDESNPPATHTDSFFYDGAMSIVVAK